MKTAVVVGSGAGGAAAARELQGRFDVTILEAGAAVPALRPEPGNSRGGQAGRPASGRPGDLASFPGHEDRPGRGRDDPCPRHRHGRDDDDRHGQRAPARRRPQGPRASTSTSRSRRSGATSRSPTGHRRIWRRPTRDLFAAAEAMGLEPQADAQDGPPRALPRLRPLRAGLPARRQMGQPRIPERRAGQGRPDRNGGPGRTAGASRRRSRRRPGPSGPPEADPCPPTSWSWRRAAWALRTSWPHPDSRACRGFSSIPSSVSRPVSRARARTKSCPCRSSAREGAS